MKRILLFVSLFFLVVVAFLGCHKDPIDFGNVGVLNLSLQRGNKTNNKAALESFDARVTIYYNEKDTISYNCRFIDTDGDGLYNNDPSVLDCIYVRREVGFWVAVQAVIQGDTVVGMSDPTNLLYLSDENPVIDVTIVLEAGYPRIIVSSTTGFDGENVLLYGNVIEGVEMLEQYAFAVKRGPLSDEEKRFWSKRVLSDVEYQELFDNGDYELFDAELDYNETNRFVGRMEMYDLDSAEYTVVALAALRMNDGDSIPSVIHSPVVSMTISNGMGPINTDPVFEWIRQGSDAATGLEEFGLYWQLNAKGIFAQIKPLEDARLYVLSSSDYAIADISELTSRLTSETEATVYNNVSVESNGTYNDVIATVYNGNTYLINVTGSTISIESNTRIVISGTYKVWASELEEYEYSRPTGYANGFGYVDLGLPSGTLWAYTNLGASLPYEHGEYYAWGETTTKAAYDWTTYQYCNGDSASITKYCSDATFGNGGFTDQLTTLESSDDAATVNRSSSWRMPTQTDFQELYDNCRRTYRYLGGTNGYLLTGPNGNSIFLPDAGNIIGSEINGTTVGNGDFGDYWTSTLGSSPYQAYIVWFYSDDFSGDVCERYFGLSIRPVCVQSKKKK